MTFKELKLHERLLRALDELGYETPTPIQSDSIPHLLNKRDLLGCAQTGTGKTAAFALPILNFLLDDEANYRRLSENDIPLIQFNCRWLNDNTCYSHFDKII